MVVAHSLNTAMVFHHTYWMASSESAGGESKSNEALVKALAELYQSSLATAESKATVMDGASVWRTEANALELRVIVGGVSKRVDDPTICEQFDRWLATP